MSIEQFIDNELKGNDVVLFMKGTPQFPMCGFSGQVVQILDYLGVPYKGLNVLENDDLRGGIKNYSNWPTIPQLYVKGEFVGGCDIVREMFQAGELQSLLKDKGVPVKEAAQASTSRDQGRACPALSGQLSGQRMRLVSRNTNASTIANPTRLCVGIAAANFSTLSATPDTNTPDEFAPRIK